jgi:hypothetical protein
MNEASPPLKQLNRTFIGSVLFIDIVGYSKRTVPDQLAMKELFNDLLAEAVQNVAPAERIMVDTGDGAAIAFLGDPEDALFAALSLRDAVDTGKVTLGETGFVRMGINLGPLKIVRDINSHTNMIGDAVNDAQRVMSFSEAGQVMVSHSYYDIISRFSRDYAQLFVYEGTRHDKHVREHEVYRFGPLEDNLSLTEKLRVRSRARQNITTEAISSTASTPPAASQSAAIRPPKVSRFGLIATVIGAVFIGGTIWSWTSTPAASGIGTTTSAPAPATATASASAEVATPVHDTPAEKEALVKESSGKQPGAADIKENPLAVTTPTKPSAAKPAADKAEDKTAKTTDRPEPEAVKPGKVKLAIQPWGEVYVNGSKRGLSPPLKSLNLAPGKHRIEIRNGQFAPHKETVEVKSGAELTVQYAF